MKMKKKNIKHFVVAISIILMMPMVSMASVTIKGKLVGVNSLTKSIMTPIDSNDPRIALEPDFVILTEDGEYYLIPNVPRKIKERNIYKKVKVVGVVNEKYRSIEADEFHVKKRIKYKIQWTKEQWEREKMRIYDDFTNLR